MLELKTKMGMFDRVLLGYKKVKTHRLKCVSNFKAVLPKMSDH